MRELDAQQGDIRGGVDPDDLRGNFPGIRQAHAHGFGACDHVTVGHDEAIRRDDKA